MNTKLSNWTVNNGIINNISFPLRFHHYAPEMREAAVKYVISLSAQPGWTKISSRKVKYVHLEMTTF